MIDSPISRIAAPLTLLVALALGWLGPWMVRATPAALPRLAAS